MVDSNYSKDRDSGRERPEDDPLMELSRIIGIDEPAVADTKQDDRQSDLALDLERELFGTYGSESLDIGDAEPVADIPETASITESDLPVDFPFTQRFASVKERDPGTHDAGAGKGRVTPADVPTAGRQEVTPAAPVAESGREPAAGAEPNEGPQHSGIDLEEELSVLLDRGGAPSGDEPGTGGAKEPPVWHSRSFDRTTSFSETPARPVQSSLSTYEAEKARARGSEAPKGAQPAHPAPQAPVAGIPAFLTERSGSGGAGPQRHVSAQAHTSTLDDEIDPLETFAHDVSLTYPKAITPKAEVPGTEPHEDRSDETEPAKPEVPRAVVPPAVETMQVPERSVEATAPLDLPVFEFDDEPAANVGLSDLESEFAEVFATLDVDQANAHGDVNSAAAEAENEFYAQAYHHSEPQRAGSPGSEETLSGLGLGGATVGGDLGYDQDYALGWGEGQDQPADFEPFDDEDEFDANITGAPPRRRRRGLATVGVIGGIAVLAAAGVWVLGMGGNNSEKAPVIVRADKEPVKVKPGEPGGTAVPNQDKDVYARADGTPQAAPEQKTLVNDTETPVSIPQEADTKKSEDRVSPAMTDNSAPPSDNSVLAMTPRRVRTVIVRPDGTIVQPSPESAPANSNNAAPAATVSQQAPNGQGGTDTSKPDVAALAPASAVSSQPLPPANEPAAASDSASSAGGTPPTAETADTRQPAVADAVPEPAVPPLAKVPVPIEAPIIPSRPATQPMTVVGTTGGATATQQVASQGSGGYMVQIAAQPTAEAAQQSYANLAQRFSKVLAGRGVDIQRAEIPNKGTYYRVRVPAASKNEALAICSEYKAAGGNCFVTR